MLLAGGALLLTACSGGSSSVSSAAKSPKPTTAHSSPTSATGAASPTFCGAAQRFASDQKTIQQQANSAAAVLSAAQDAQAAIPEMQRVAPSSIAADVNMVTSGFKPFFDALVANHGVVSQALGVEQQISSTVRTAQFQAAASALGNYQVQSCGFAPSTGH
jgi:hypothetical protein